MVHTSGTTGRPKLVPLTHDQLITAVTFMSLEVPEAAPGARHLSALPLFHVAGLANLCLRAVHRRAPARARRVRARPGSSTSSPAAASS